MERIRRSAGLSLDRLEQGWFLLLCGFRCFGRGSLPVKGTVAAKLIVANWWARQDSNMGRSDLSRNNVMRCSCVLIIGGALLAVGIVAASAQQRKSLPAKPRVVITADPELDDNNTLIRAILYSPDFNIEGLIYASSQF